MNITDVQLVLAHEERLKAYVTITIDNCFVIRDIKIILGHSGLFVAMPAKKRKDGSFRDIAHPINQEMRQLMEERILKVFDELQKTPNNAAS